MGNVKKLLDEAKQRTGAESDYALAKTLELPTQRISDYYKGSRAPDELACSKIAEATGKTFECVVYLVKADTEKDEKRREYWTKKLYALGQSAAASVLAILAVVIFNMSAMAGNASAATGSGGQTLYYVKSRAWIRKAAEAAQRRLSMLFRPEFYSGWLNGGIRA